MIPDSLGRLAQVELRNVFTTEAGDFTPWLAIPENLALLGETIEMSLQLEAQEKPVGPFRADILCKDVDTEQWVLIENQIERTDHTHLGQLLTYAAGLDAVTIIWIAKRITDEHRAALDWLNEKTAENINFFGLEIELWKIGDSKVAPKFNVVSQPNAWSKNIKTGVGEGKEISDLRQLQVRFWTAFCDSMEGSLVRCQKPKPNRAMNHPIGRAGMYLRSVISTWDAIANVSDPELRVAFVLEGADSKRRFAVLEQRKDQIERACGCTLTWVNQPEKQRCRIYVREKADFLNENLWPAQQKWLREKLELFQRVLVPIAQGNDFDSPPIAIGASAK